MHDERHAILVNEIRYAERLTQRTARLYRHAATICTFIAIVGGSGLASSLSSKVPDWVALAGAALLGIAGAAALAVRPLEKAVANEVDAKKYAALRTQSLNLDAVQLETALQKARESDAPEVECLRDVAYNDVVTEVGRADLVAPLTLRQMLMGAMA